MFSEKFVASREITSLAPSGPLTARQLARLLPQLTEQNPRAVVETLRSLPPGARFQIALGLVDMSFREVHHDAARSLAIALRAAVVSRHLTGEHDLAPEIRAATLLFLANALRVRQHLASAKRCWVAVHRQMSGIRNAALEATRSYFEALFLAATRDFTPAIGLLEEAADEYARLGNRLLSSFAKTSLAKAHHVVGDARMALRHIQEAVERMPREAGTLPRLLLMHDLTLFTALGGYPVHAYWLYRNLEPVYACVGSDLLRVREAWLKAHLALEMDGPELAARGYGWVKEAMAKRQLYYDAALAGLDQAKALARCGRSEDVKKLAEELVPVFQAHGIEREVRMAMEQWVEAVRRQQTDEATVQSTLDVLRVLACSPLDVAALP